MYFKTVNKIDKNYKKNVIIYFEDKVEICEHISEENKILLKKIIEENNFTGSNGEALEAPFIEDGNLVNMVLLGVGREDSYVKDDLRKSLYKILKDVKGKVLVSSYEEKLQDADTIAEVSNYLNYNFNKYKTDKKDEKLILEFFSNLENADGEEGNILGQAVNITRDLINEPANVIYPESLAEHTVKLGSEYGFTVEVMDEDSIEKIGMTAYLTVSRAAEKKPKLIVMRYIGDSETPEKITGLVGKGLTYDTGGLSLKPSDGMASMKSDMG